MDSSEKPIKHSSLQVQEAIVRALKGDDRPASERGGARVTRFLHQLSLDASTYEKMLHARGSEAAQHTAFDFLEQHLEELQPRDPIERMLAVQILWQHIRISTLCVRESLTKDPKEAAALRSSIEQAMNTFRRQARTMRDLQAPRSPNIISGGQVNVGDGQIVTNSQLNGAVSCANELGCDDVDEAFIPVDASRPSEPARLGPAREALDTLDGAENGRGKTNVKSEREDARAPRRRNARRRAGAGGGSSRP